MKILPGTETIGNKADLGNSEKKLDSRHGRTRVDFQRQLNHRRDSSTALPGYSESATCCKNVVTAHGMIISNVANKEGANLFAQEQVSWVRRRHAATLLRHSEGPRGNRLTQALRVLARRWLPALAGRRASPQPPLPGGGSPPGSRARSSAAHGGPCPRACGRLA